MSQARCIISPLGRAQARGVSRTGGVWLDTIKLEMSPLVLAGLSRMTWRFLTFDRFPAFLTSDNPFFYFSDLGIGNMRSEVTFPISSSIALWATLRGDLAEGYFPAKESLVREFNRRTASTATRHAFHAVDEEWVLPLLRKSRWRISPMGMGLGRSL